VCGCGYGYGEGVRGEGAVDFSLKHLTFGTGTKSEVCFRYLAPLSSPAAAATAAGKGSGGADSNSERDIVAFSTIHQLRTVCLSSQLTHLRKCPGGEWRVSTSEREGDIIGREGVGAFGQVEQWGLQVGAQGIHVCFEEWGVGGAGVGQLWCSWKKGQIY